MPISYSIEPTNHCNLECPECPSGTGELTRPLGLLTLDDFKIFVDQIKNTGFYIQLFFQGEPYINKKLPDMIEYAQKNKIYVSVSTNGILINEKSIESIFYNTPDKLIFSIDGIDEETYQKYRIGGTFKDADNGLRLLMKRKIEGKSIKPFVELQFIIMKHNEHQIEEVKKYTEELKVDKVVFKTMQVSSYDSAIKFLPSCSNHSRYIVENGTVRSKNKIKNHCFALWRTSVITWDGKLVPCCFDKDANYEFGSLNGKNIKGIWLNKKSMKFRQIILHNRENINMCTNCTEGQKINISEI